MILTERNKRINRQTKTEKDAHFSRLPKKVWINRHSPGFTLVELLTVIVILAILAAIALMTALFYIEKAENVVALSEVVNLEKEILLYGGVLPPDLDAIGYPNFLDPWGRPYVYQTVATRTRAGNPINTDYDLYSMGKDGKTAQDLNNPLSQDDIIRAGDGKYKGLVENY